MPEHLYDLAERGVVACTKLPLTARDWAGSIRANARYVDREIRAPARWLGLAKRNSLDYGDMVDLGKIQDTFNHLAELSQLASPPGITKELLFEVHDRAQGGRSYRNVGVVSGGYRYREARQVAARMSEILEELPRQLAADPVVGSAWLHMELVAIHPFEDGNGRTARLIASYVLLHGGFRSTLFTAVEQHFAGDFIEYYRTLRAYDEGVPGQTVTLIGLLRAMYERSAGAAWFRIRNLKLLRLCEEHDKW